MPLNINNVTGISHYHNDKDEAIQSWKSHQSPGVHGCLMEEPSISQGTWVFDGRAIMVARCLMEEPSWWLGV